MPVAAADTQEQLLLDIVRVLSPDRTEQLIDFARFLEAQLLREELFGAEIENEVEADNARWDALLSSDDGQAMLNSLADEALAEHRVGKTKPMIFSTDGRIVPG